MPSEASAILTKDFYCNNSAVEPFIGSLLLIMTERFSIEYRLLYIFFELLHPGYIELRIKGFAAIPAHNSFSLIHLFSEVRSDSASSASILRPDSVVVIAS